MPLLYISFHSSRHPFYLFLLLKNKYYLILLFTPILFHSFLNLDGSYFIFIPLHSIFSFLFNSFYLMQEKPLYSTPFHPSHFVSFLFIPHPTLIYHRKEETLSLIIFSFLAQERHNNNCRRNLNPKSLTTVISKNCIN